jgi:serine/threonine protein kinase/WD40 repeat protein
LTLYAFLDILLLLSSEGKAMGVKCPKCQHENPDDTLFCGKCGTQFPSPDKAEVTETLETPKEELTTGFTFAGRYQIIEELGRGGMGKVYRALDKELNEEVALKLIKPEIAKDEKTIERFKNELKIARKISHRNVGRMYELMDDGGFHFITMEYVPGQDLRGLERQTGQLTTGKAISITKEVCEGLREAHRQGVIHRDLKPSNIIIDKNGNARILDFGIARSVEGKGITGAGVMIGTPEYMSPEQVEGKEVDQRSDIYSLGVVLFEMVTGKVPFEGDTPLGIAMKHKSEIPKDPKAINAQIPDDISQMILRCLEKDKEKRYQSVVDVLSELTKIEKGIPTTEPVVPKRKPKTSREITVTFGLKKLLIPSLVVIAILAVASYFLFLSNGEIVDIRIGRTHQITRAPGLEIEPAISPDSKFIAYSSGLPAGQMDIYIQQIAGGRIVALTQDIPGNQRWPQWFHDGTQVIFQSAGAIYIVPTLGGIPRLLVDSPAFSPALSPDGDKIGFARGNAIYVQSLHGGEPYKIADTFNPHSLCWSPDGSRIAFVSGNSSYVFGQVFFGNIAPSSIWIVSASEGNLIQVTDKRYLNMSPVWMPDGRRLLYVSDQGGSRDVYQISLSPSGRPSRLPVRISTGLNAQIISLSSDGNNLAYSILTVRANIWSIRISEEEPISISEAEPVTIGNQVIEDIAISPDGEWLAFDLERNGNVDIYKMRRHGGEPERLTTHPSGDFVHSWSSRGEIAFQTFRNGNRDIYVISSDGRSIQQVTSSPSQERVPSWSPDGKKLVFGSDRTGRSELFIIAKKDEQDKSWGPPHQLTFKGGMYPRWSPDGRFIAYLNRGVWVISPEGGEAHLLVQSQDPSITPYPAWVGWSTDSKTVYYRATDTEGRPSFWSVPVSGGTPKLLVRFDDPSKQTSWIVFATDGRQFFFVIREHESDVWVMELLKNE